LLDIFLRNQLTV